MTTPEGLRRKLSDEEREKVRTRLREIRARIIQHKVIPDQELLSLAREYQELHAELKEDVA